MPAPTRPTALPVCGLWTSFLESPSRLIRDPLPEEEELSTSFSAIITSHPHSQTKFLLKRAQFFSPRLKGTLKTTQPSSSQPWLQVRITGGRQLLKNSKVQTSVEAFKSDSLWVTCEFGWPSLQPSSLPSAGRAGLPSRQPWLLMGVQTYPRLRMPFIIASAAHTFRNTLCLFHYFRTSNPTST